MVDLGRFELPTPWLQTVNRGIATDCDIVRLAAIHALAVVVLAFRQVARITTIFDRRVHQNGNQISMPQNGATPKSDGPDLWGGGSLRRCPLARSGADSAQWRGSLPARRARVCVARSAEKGTPRKVPSLWGELFCKLDTSVSL